MEAARAEGMPAAADASSSRLARAAWQMTGIGEAFQRMQGVQGVRLAAKRSRPAKERRAMRLSARPEPSRRTGRTANGWRSASPGRDRFLRIAPGPPGSASALPSGASAGSRQQDGTLLLPLWGVSSAPSPLGALSAGSPPGAGASAPPRTGAGPSPRCCLRGLLQGEEAASVQGIRRGNSPAGAWQPDASSARRHVLPPNGRGPALRSPWASPGCWLAPGRVWRSPPGRRHASAGTTALTKEGAFGRTRTAKAARSPPRRRGKPWGRTLVRSFQLSRRVPAPARQSSCRRGPGSGRPQGNGRPPLAARQRGPGKAVRPGAGAGARRLEREGHAAEDRLVALHEVAGREAVLLRAHALDGEAG